MGAALEVLAARRRPTGRSERSARWLGLLLVTTVLMTACGPREEIVYVDRDQFAATLAGAYQGFGRSADPRVHADGTHHSAVDVQIGPGEAAGHSAPYAPLGSGGGPLVHANGQHQIDAAVAIAHERQRASRGTHVTPASAPPTAGSALPASAVVPARVTASPTVPTRLALGTGLGASVGTTVPSNALSLAEDDDELATVVGRIESIVGSTLTVQTAAGANPVRLTSAALVERDALGSSGDLKPGQFVGAVQVPDGPATSVRLYHTGPSMPRAGIVPLIGSRRGEVSTFGSIVTLQFGGLLLNTGSQTTAVTMPNGVEILKPVAATASDLRVGVQVIATGPLAGDGTLAATAVRITAAPPPRDR